MNLRFAPVSKATLAQTACGGLTGKQEDYYGSSDIYDASAD